LHVLLVKYKNGGNEESTYEMAEQTSTKRVEYLDVKAQGINQNVIKCCQKNPEKKDFVTW
jgi:hypothetical protein